MYHIDIINVSYRHYQCTTGAGADQKGLLLYCDFIVGEKKAEMEYELRKYQQVCREICYFGERDRVRVYDVC